MCNQSIIEYMIPWELRLLQHDGLSLEMNSLNFSDQVEFGFADQVNSEFCSMMNFAFWFDSITYLHDPSSVPY